MEENIEFGDFTFLNNFDSANLAKVEKVEINKVNNGKSQSNKTHKNSLSTEFPSYEFNLWTKYDCHGTEFQNNNKTWFYFGIKSTIPGILVKINIVNLNKQVKMFSQGMSPVFKVIPGHPQWERIKEKPSFIADDKNNEFILSFNYRTSENSNAVTYFAFTYPFSYTDLQSYLRKIDIKMSKYHPHHADGIYYHRECAIKSLEGRRLDILTISSYNNVLKEREAKIKDLFPDENEKRPFKFQDKKIIFISARVHPGETPSSFVLNGFLNLLLNKDDPIAIALRRLYVFKLIPMLNPDGVAQGFYRMDTRGVNLNRLYLNPSKSDHPTIFAAKMLLRYYHNSYNLPEEQIIPEIETRTISTHDTEDSINIIQSISKETNKLLQRVTLMSLEEKTKYIEQGNRIRNLLVQASEKSILKNQDLLESQSEHLEALDKLRSTSSIEEFTEHKENSGIFLYIDFHGHASKKGIFMFGNHFEDPEDSSNCMLLPKLMSINNPNFHFTSCNFAEKNMYLIDKRDGMSREGSGRVAVYKLTGLIHSYTLECNYNTGRSVNTVPARVKDVLQKAHGQLFVPPKYNPAVFEEVGAALGPSILDMTGSNPNSRLPNTQYRSLKGLKSYLKLICTNQYQTSLSKPLHKNNDGDQFRYLQEATSDDLLEKPLKNTAIAAILASKSKTKLQFTNNSCKFFRTTNIYGNIKNIKNYKKPCQVTSRNMQKFSTVIKNSLEIKCKFVASTKKKKVSYVKPNFPARSRLSTKTKAIEKMSRVKLPIKNSMKKPITVAKKSISKKELLTASKNSIVNISHTKHKMKINSIVKNKKLPIKLEYKSPKNASITKASLSCFYTVTK